MTLKTPVLTVFVFLFTSVIYSEPGVAQERPIGFWRSHLPTNTATGIATDGSINHVITGKGFFTFKTSDGYVEFYSKVEGLHDTNPVVVDYDEETETTIIGYENSNIDLIRNYNVKVIPDLKNKSFAGSKSIRDLYTENGIAYLSTGVGILVLDLKKQEVKETYVFAKNRQTMGINAFIGDNQYFYAAAERGLYRIARTATAPHVFTNWEALDTQRVYTRLAMNESGLYAASSGLTDSLYRITGATAQLVWYRDSTNFTSLDGIGTTLYAGVFNTWKGLGRIYHFSNQHVIVDSTFIAYPKGVVRDAAGVLWAADLYQGLGKRNEDRSLQFIVPGGPNDPVSYDIYARGGEVWVAHGGVYPASYLGLRKRNGLSQYKADKWNWLTAYTYPLFRDTVVDFLEVTKDERTGTLYAGSHSSGIFELKADGSSRMIKQGALLPNSSGEYPATGLAIDQNGSLWVNQNGLAQELAEGRPDGTWEHYFVPPLSRSIAPHAATKVLVDDANQKWYFAPYGGGVIVFHEGQYRNLTQGKGGNGNLPSNTVLSIMKDRDGAIWIGTDKGIGIINNPYQVLSDPSVEAELRVVQFDQFAGHLFSNEAILAMAVDGANRKWIGTVNGLWLLSADANKIIHRFTIDNSPLPSNVINSIAVDDLTGDVYFGTADGLVSYRGTATEGNTTASNNIKTFPSPVPAGYSGPIAINGFTTDADVRITDIAGQLVYRAKATGGQLVWNGLDYTGHRPQSGVLLIFASNKDGSQTAVGKMLFMH